MLNIFSKLKRNNIAYGAKKKKEKFALTRYLMQQILYKEITVIKY